MQLSWHQTLAAVGLVGPLALLGSVGCSPDGAGIPQRRPRPVSVKPLVPSLPDSQAMVTASVGSWKTEQIGFEVSGRVEFVVEPNTEIEGRLRSKTGELMYEGTPIGRIESERYELQVEKAKSDVTQAEQKLSATKTELSESIPAQIAAAEAARELAEIEFERAKRLLNQNAGSQGDVDQTRANVRNAAAQLLQLDAAKTGKQAEVQSLESALSQAKQNLRDAERDLEDCTLYSSYRGQVADVSVVPGSVVNAGQAVATIQMMDPIKIELEVSAEDSRRLQQLEMLPVLVTMPDGRPEVKEGYLYLVDSVADPLTRTFTVTLLVLNEKLTPPLVDGITATTDQTWRLDFKFLPGAEDNTLFADKDAILKDDQGYYLWRVTNADKQSGMPRDRILEVSRLPVELGPLLVPFLGQLDFSTSHRERSRLRPCDQSRDRRAKCGRGRAGTMEWRRGHY